jgi:hypothetical protein
MGFFKFSEEERVHIRFLDAKIIVDHVVKGTYIIG